VLGRISLILTFWFGITKTSVVGITTQAGCCLGKTIISEEIDQVKIHETVPFLVQAIADEHSYVEPLALKKGKNIHSDRL